LCRSGRTEVDGGGFNPCATLTKVVFEAHRSTEEFHSYDHGFQLAVAGPVVSTIRGSTYSP
jgi:hypothetical protein